MTTFQIRYLPLACVFIVFYRIFYRMYIDAFFRGQGPFPITVTRDPWPVLLLRHHRHALQLPQVEERQQVPKVFFALLNPRTVHAQHCEPFEGHTEITRQRKRATDQNSLIPNTWTTMSGLLPRPLRGWPGYISVKSNGSHDCSHDCDCSQSLTSWRPFQSSQVIVMTAGVRYVVKS